MLPKTRIRTWAFLFLLFALSSPYASTIDLAYKPARIDNPLKGLAISQGNFPHSLSYLDSRLAPLMPAPGQFDWSTLDQRLARVAASGRHAVLRVHLDWAGRSNTIPSFLESESSITTDLWRKGDRVPNYNSPLLQSALLEFVAAFGKKYDAHPDIAFIEAGLLGVWGEWLPVGRLSPAAPPEFEKQIITAYQQAFKTTKILYRFPTEFTLQHNAGYHDDWFAHKNELTRPLFSALTNSTYWHNSPIGGRVHPEIQRCLYKSSNPCQWTDFNFLSARLRHFTYLRLDLPMQFITPGPTQDQITELARSLGYEFHVTSAAVDFNSATATLKIDLQIRNTGAAPFYYRWPMELALAKNGAIQHQWTTNWDIRTILPADNPFPLSAVQKLPFPPSDHLLLLRIRDTSNRIVSFANQSQDSVLPGWLTLGTVR